MVKNALAPLLETFPHEWDELLPYVRLAVNTAVHRSTGEQLLYLLMGHHGSFPRVNINYLEVDLKAAGAYVQRLQEARCITAETSTQAREKWTKDFNKHLF